MNVLPFLLELKKLDINIEVVDDQLKINAPGGKLTADLIKELKNKKAEIIGFMQENLQKKVKYESVQPSEKKEYYSLSAAQKRLYILQQMDVDITGYNMPQALALKGKIDIQRLKKTFEKLIYRHESLRTSFHMIGDEPVQVVHDQVEFEMEHYQVEGEVKVEEERSPFLEGTRGLAPLSIEPATRNPQPAAAQISSFIRPFDLAAAPLLRVGLIKLAHTPTALRGHPSQEGKEDKYLLMVDIHHIISDGTSQTILTKEFMSLYQGSELAPLGLQYKDYSQWQNSPKVSEAIRRQEEFWLRQLDGEIPVLSMPYDFPRPAVQSFAGNTAGFRLSKEETKRLNEVARSQGATLFMVLLAVYNIFLSKISGQEDIVVGTPSAGRQHKDLEPIIGMFVNTLALRSYSPPGKRFLEYLGEVKEITMGAYENQDYPFEELVEKVSISRDLSRNPLFDVMFVLQNILTPQPDEKETEIEDLKLIPMPFAGRASKFDLSLEVHESKEKLYLEFEYCTKLFKEETLNRFIGYIKAVVLSVIEEPGKKISEIEILSEKERKQVLYDFNDTEAEYPKDKTIHQLFEEQTEQTPDHVALKGNCQLSIVNDQWPTEAVPSGQVLDASGEMQLSYRELNEKSQQLAYLLQAKGVKSDTIVGIMVERSGEMIIGILGILKAGGAYLPIDPDFPAERKKYMLKDSSANLLVTTPGLSEEFEKLLIVNCQLLIVNCQGEKIPYSHLHLPPAPATCLAYVIYTSGSTGRPKGVMITHRPVINFIKGMTAVIDFTGNDTILSLTTISFDIFLLETLLPLSAGCKVVLGTDAEQQDPEAAAKTLWKQQVSILQVTPSRLTLMISIDQAAAALKPLKYLLIGGETLPGQLLEKARGITNAKIYNLYGPTETTVWSTVKNVSLGKSLNIGKPIINTRVYILGKNSTPQPVGVVGDLYIGGHGLARGYANKPQLTAERFLPVFYRSYRSHRSYNSYLSYYQTGDLARWLPDGNIEFLGRRDNQVKIRGFRIELGEIENCLLAGDEVKEAVVTAGERDDGDKYLCAYIVPARGPGDSEEKLDINRLKEYLSHDLPPYMIPAYFVLLDKIPLNPSGKVDRKALPVPGIKGEAGLIPPTNKIEEKLVNTWSEVLGIKREVIGINSNFFNLGGHSLRATLLVSKIYKEFNIKMTIAEVFARPRIKELAGYITTAKKSIFEEIVSVEKKEYYPQSSAQKRLFLLDRFENIGTSYHTPIVLKVEGKIQEEKFENAINKLICRHETLRTSFELRDNEAIQRVHRDVDFKIEEITTRGKDIKRIIKDFVRPFDLSGVPLVRVGLAPLSQEQYLFLFDMHHIIGDATSMGILMGEMAGFHGGGELPPQRVQYKDFSCWQNLLFKKGKIQLQEKYWLDLYPDTSEIPRLNLPLDYPRPAIFSYKGERYSFQPGLEDSVRFKEIGTRAGVTSFMNLLAVFNLVLFKYTGQEDIIVGCDIAGRPHVDLQRIIGMFVNELAIRNFPWGKKTYIQFLEEVKENSINAFENQDYQFEELVDRLNLERDTSRNPLFDVEFVFQNFERPAIELKDVSVTPFAYENKTANFDIAFDARESGDQIYLGFQYCTSLFKPKTIRRLANHLLNAMRAVSRDPGTLLADISILSEEDKQQILFEFNDTNRDFAKDKSYPQLFEIQAVKTPDRIAAIYKDEFLAYSQLEETSTQLARYLYFEKGIRTDDRVGVVLDRSNYFLTAVIGIMKAGAAYIPIEPFLPAERVKTIVNDAQIGVLVSRQEYLENLRQLQEECSAFHTIQCLDNDNDNDNDNEQPLTKSFCRGVQGGQFFQKAPPLAAGGIAYVIYTSGTSGEPKGVMIQQRGMINHIYAKINDLLITGEDIIAQTASAGFDISVWQFLAGLLVGGVTLIIEKEIVLEPGSFLQVLQKGRVTILESVPSLMSAFLEITAFEKDKELKYLRWMVPTGEALSAALVRRWYDIYPGIKLVNAYGPTEASDDVTHYLVEEKPPADQKSIPIGKPLQNLHIYILDKYLSLCPVGVRGEICVAGVGVGKGYLNNPELTFEKFDRDLWDYRDYQDKKYMSLEGTRGLAPLLPGKNHMQSCNHATMQYKSPPHSSIPPIPQSPIYRTGDIGYWKEDGNIECLGRMDQQVKIRGNRIELEEIESQLSHYPGIKKVVVLAREDRTGNKYLCAYICTKPKAQGTGRGEASITIESAELRAFLAKNLPDYMIPTYFVQLANIPLTPNGKVDRKALPEPGIEDRTGKYTAPRDRVEKKLQEIWCELLDKNTPISIDENFFQLGGHSLRAAVMTTKIHKEMNVNVPLAQIFATPTIRELSQYIARAGQNRYISIKPVEKQEYYPLSSAQKRLYFLQHMDINPTSYNMPFVLPLGKDTGKNRIESALIKLIHRHESLRTSFKKVDNQPVQEIHQQVDFTVDFYEAEAAAVKEIIKNYIRPFDLSKTPLIRSGIIKQPDNNYTWMVDIHHIVSDGTSQAILAEDFIFFYNNEIPGPLRIQYKDFTQWQNRLFAGDGIKTQGNYWKELYAGEIPRLNLPTDNKRPGVFTYEGDNYDFKLEREDAAKFKALGSMNGGTLYMNILAALNTLFYRYTGQEDIIIGSGIAGRRHADLQEIIGMFVNTLAMRNYPGGDKTYRSFLKEVIENSIKAFDNQDVQFEELVEMIKLERDASRNPLFDIMMVVQNFSPVKKSILNPAVNELKIAEERRPEMEYTNKTSKFDMTFFIMEADEDVFISVEYYTSIFKRESIARLAGHLKKIIKEVVLNPSIKLKDIEILSAREKQRVLYELNNTAVPYPETSTIVGLFEMQVEKTPAQTALVFGEEHVTYKVLEEQANRIANYLNNDGSRWTPEQPVGVMMERNPAAIAAVIGILKAGSAYVPISPSYPEERIKHMIDDARIKNLVSQKQYIKTLNRLQWECERLETFLCLDSEEVHSEDEAQESELMSRKLWEYVGETAADEITGGGWNSSYTGEPIPKKEMDEYGDNILEKLQPLLHPRMRVLEIGCASGISMYRIAPRVGFYYGTDLSAAIIAANRKRIEKEQHKNIKLARLAAHEIHQLDETGFDLVIMNSVIQCFNGHNYFKKVLQKAINLLGNKGYLFIGDIMDQDLKGELTADLLKFKQDNRNKNNKTKTDWSEELFISRNFLEDLAWDYPAIQDMKFSNKIYTIENELTKFRYDALICIDKAGSPTPSQKGKKTKKHKHQHDISTLRKYGTGRVKVGVKPGDMAYIIYTSGSSGIPKGVMAEHKNVVRLVKNTNYLDFKKVEKILQTGALEFDASTFEIWGVLLNGLTLVLESKNNLLHPGILKETIDKNKITTMWMTSSYFNRMLEADIKIFGRLKHLLVGGEILSPTHIDRLRNRYPRLQIINGYGPTENVTFSTTYLIDKDYEHNIPIGKPIANSTAYIVDRHGHIQPMGIPGELYVGGAGVARGYLNDPQLTAEKFITPLNRSYRSYKSYISKKLYKTGDLARWQPEGNIEFLGRLDQQVKLRGYRIEIGEIIHQLLTHKVVQEAAVLIRNQPDGEKYLCAYIVAAGVLEETSFIAELRAFLSQKLPHYMVPAFFIMMDDIPLTPNGKIDREALPEPGISLSPEEYTAPRDEIEEKIAEMWSETLGIRKEKISINSNFFKIGGHSLTIVKLTAMMKKELGVEIPLTFLYEKPYIKDISLFIKAGKYEEQPVTLLNPGVTTQGNLFCFPPGGAYGLGYREFANIIKHFSVYTCHFIEEEARLERYVRIITGIQPGGPYIMLGYSFAGKLIFQVTKAFENHGLEVSDIILVDSLLVKERNPEEIAENFKNFVIKVQERMEDRGIGFLKERVKEKMEKYLMYNLSITNLEKIHANVHLILSEETPLVNPGSLNCWDEFTAKSVVRLQGFGNHASMFEPGPLQENTKIIQGILDKIKAQ